MWRHCTNRHYLYLCLIFIKLDWLCCALRAWKTYFASFGFKDVFLGFPVDFCADYCLGWRLLVAAYDGAFGFSSCGINAAFCLSFC